jgi:formamidopyrimidine-DNA glycosylase
MPELPEVETIRHQMEKELIGDSVDNVDVLDRSVFTGDENSLTGEKIRHVGRIGKYLFVHFESGRGLSVHLKMTGRLILGDTGEPDIDYDAALHKRIVFTLASGRRLYYWDTRKFGFVNVTEDIEQAEENTKQRLGPDPWQMDEMTLLRKLNKSKKAIKNVLLDQVVISGVGNIYANDGLWLAGIRPDRLAGSLKLTEIKKLLESLRAVMDRGFATGGASDNTYRDLYGNKGGYQNEFLVYGKTHGECLKCGRELIYTRIGGRGTWCCAHCQT